MGSFQSPSLSKYPPKTARRPSLTAFILFFVDNPLILLIFTILVILALLRLGNRSSNWRRHGPKLDRDLELYAQRQKRTDEKLARGTPAKTIDDIPAPQPEFNVDGKRIN